MGNILIKQLQKEHQDYLRDESRKIGLAESISFPKTEQEIKDILLYLNNTKTPVTVQGARTGITAGSVPKNGHILNLSKMNNIKALSYDKNLDTFLVTVEPGVILCELRTTLKNKNFDTKNWNENSLNSLKQLRSSDEFFFSPDPTESTAAIAGMVACNASGACSFKYGPTRNYIEGLKITLITGDTFSIKRGENTIKNGKFSITTDSGRVIEGCIPKYSMPKVKNASGYYAMEDMDLIDLFIGSEGTLGIITEIKIKLLKKPKSIYGVTAFFDSEEKSLNFVESLRENLNPAAIEFFNNKALNLIRKEKEKNPAFEKLLDLPKNFHTAVYSEYHDISNDKNLNTLLKVGTLMENCGGCEAHTWVAINSQAEEQLHFFRHAVPEAVNLLIDERRKEYPSLTKLGTDMAVPNSKLKEVMKLYNDSLEASNLESVIFGHIGDNHLHVNIIPKNMDDYKKGKELYNSWSKKIVSMGGTISAEHGVGKLKTSLFKQMVGTSGLKEMKSLKLLFDPDNRLNCGNLFEE
ncbi:oxidoreductase, FAD-binding [Clostridium botulinum C str. Eklund]|nr:oxidoreductase, FAD-binding [Clostridium botulinum C str. Eklund]NEZ49969.1 FAD-binding oxidoreductase [Clostridium botulinum]